MIRYTCDGFRPITASGEDWEKDIAETFGDRLARRLYGKRGYCRHARLENWVEDHSCATYEVFIGTPAPGGGTVGKNVRLSIYSKEEA